MLSRYLESHQVLDILVFSGDAFDIARVAPQSQADSIQGAAAEDEP